MATAYSEEPPSRPTALDRRTRRRRATVDEALDHALAVMAERGAGALTVSEVARRMGVRGPSLYKYFPSLHAMYDALYARGVAANIAAVREATAGTPAGMPRIRAGVAATVRWCVEHPALAQLLYWRPVPGFEPSAEAFSASVEDMRQVRAELAEAVRLRQLSRAADSDEAARILTVLISGLVSQQMANQPGAGYDDGLFTSLTEEALDLFVAHYRPRRRT